MCSIHGVLYVCIQWCWQTHLQTENGYLRSWLPLCVSIWNIPVTSEKMKTIQIVNVAKSFICIKPHVWVLRHKKHIRSLSIADELCMHTHTHVHVCVQMSNSHAVTGRIGLDWFRSGVDGKLNRNLKQNRSCCLYVYYNRFDWPNENKMIYLIYVL